MKRSIELAFGAISFCLLCGVTGGCNSQVAKEPDNSEIEPLVGEATSDFSPEIGDGELAVQPDLRRGYDLTGFDLDSDGKVSREEATGRFLAVFNDVDADADGFVDNIEFGTFLTQFATARSDSGPPSNRDANEPAVIAMLERVGGSFSRADTGRGPGKIAIVTLVNTQASDKDLEELKSLTELFGLELEGGGFTDDGLALVATFDKLANIVLAGKQFTDKGLAHIQSMPALKMVKLKGTSVGREGLVTLSKLPSLEFVDFAQHKIGPDTLEAMKEFPQLEGNRPHRLRDFRGSSGIAAPSAARLRRAG